MTALIEQRGGSDCVIAAIAMALGRPYEDVLEAAADEFDPAKGCRNEQKVLERLGLRYTFENGEPVGDIVCRRKDWCLSPDFYRAMIWGRPALVTVPSLNIPGGHHMVFYDGHQVPDPNPPTKKRYTEFSQLEPTNVVLFRNGVCGETA